MKYLILLLTFISCTFQGFSQDTTTQQILQLLSYMDFNPDKATYRADYIKRTDDRRIFIQEHRDSFIQILDDGAVDRLYAHYQTIFTTFLTDEEISQTHHFFKTELGQKMRLVAPSLQKQFNYFGGWLPTKSFKSKLSMDDFKAINQYFRKEGSQFADKAMVIWKECFDVRIIWEEEVVALAFARVVEKNKVKDNNSFSKMKSLYETDFDGCKNIKFAKFKTHYEINEPLDVPTIDNSGIPPPPPPPPPPSIYFYFSDTTCILEEENGDFKAIASVTWLSDCRFILKYDYEDYFTEEKNEMVLEFHIYEIKDDLYHYVSSDGDEYMEARLRRLE